MLSSSAPLVRRLAAPLSLWLSLAALGLAACLWFPGALTSPEGRALYPLASIAAFTRVLLALACLAGLVAMTGPARGLGAIGVGLGLVALVVSASARLVRATGDQGLVGLDWLVVDGLVMVLVLIPLERLSPHREAPARRSGWRTDAVYFLLNHLAVRWIGGFGVIGALAGGLVHRESVIATLPLPLQVLLLLVATDLAQYALHRAMHEVPWLWRIHAVHHASEHMDALAGSRVHLAESFMTRTTLYLVAIALGVAPAVFLIYGALMALHGSLIHANVSWDYGWLEHFIVSPRFHHWHHASDAEAIDTNYAGTFPIIDRIFRTHHLPAERWPDRYGVVKESVPESFLAQQVFPFRA